MRISEWRWRITCRYRSRDQRGNFRKFKMAEGRHFENSFISISQSRIIQFRSNLVRSCKFPSRRWLDKNRNFSNSRWRTDAILKIVSAISRRLIGRLTWNSEWRRWITCSYRSRDQKWKFSEIHDGGRPPFWRVFGIYVILVMNWCYPLYFNRRTSFNEIMKTANII